MRTENEYRRFAAASLESSEKAKNPADKFGLLIMAKAWFDLAELTTQLVENEATEAHRMVERPLERATVHGSLRVAD